MARGNQRDLARAKNLKKQAEQKSKNSKSGSEMQRDKEAVAALMREKQKKAEEKKAAEAANKK
ncbi:four F5 protein [Cryphonectria parasitica EP155]|uniref:Four F5 protein n=1 Tax=Cryphonectria parasitica (strain ATCC 38755 / EP155) TaxID=660469 RepID=A0A9P4Y444_CRYP1|nr:four F5 protein [Cryphonectria parasitica EP155]KAF3765810.1 four F5 protein [Cryphonectria parasitica EP155]